MSSDLEFMRHAVRLSHEHMKGGAGGPFGAVIVKDGKVIGEGWNQVTSTHDPTAHAEIVAIRNACRHIGDFRLNGAVIYTSCEPCPMCLAAILWSRLDSCFYANSRADAAAIGFDDANFYRQVALPINERQIPFTRIGAEEALTAFQAWTAKADKVRY